MFIRNPERCSPKYEQAARWNSQRRVRRSRGEGFPSPMAADQPSKTGSFCTREATHPRHVTVIARRPPFRHRTTSAPWPNRCANATFCVTEWTIPDEQPAVRTVADVVASPWLHWHQHIVERWKCSNSTRIVNKNRACVPSVSWNVQHELKRSRMHPCGRAKEYPSLVV